VASTRVALPELPTPGTGSEGSRPIVYSLASTPLLARRAFPLLASDAGVAAAVNPPASRGAIAPPLGGSHSFSISTPPAVPCRSRPAGEGRDVGFLGPPPPLPPSDTRRPRARRDSSSAFLESRAQTRSAAAFGRQPFMVPSTLAPSGPPEQLVRDALHVVRATARSRQELVRGRSGGRSRSPAGPGGFMRLPVFSRESMRLPEVALARPAPHRGQALAPGAPEPSTVSRTTGRRSPRLVPAYTLRIPASE